MDVIELQCLKAVPDIVHEYSSSIKQNHIPLVIDNGMYMVLVFVTFVLYLAG